MKPIICAIAVAAVLLITPTAKALYGHVAAERDRREHAEQQIEQQQLTNQRLFIVISILSAGVVTALVVGTAIGSKTRRDREP